MEEGGDLSTTTSDINYCQLVSEGGKTCIEMEA